MLHKERLSCEAHGPLGLRASQPPPVQGKIDHVDSGGGYPTQVSVHKTPYSRAHTEPGMGLKISVAPLGTAAEPTSMDRLTPHHLLSRGPSTFYFLSGVTSWKPPGGGGGYVHSGCGIRDTLVIAGPSGGEQLCRAVRYYPSTNFLSNLPR